VQDLDIWLAEMADRPLPGGVAAAAVAAAMGAALIGKTARVTLQHQELSPAGQATWQAVRALARDRRGELLRLADEDEKAYRAVLSARGPVRRGAQQAATEIPLLLAESCQALLTSLAGLEETCRPIVRADLLIGRRLLSCALVAGILAAEDNLQAWAEDPAVQSMRQRMDAVRPAQPEGGN
jgi:formiminotetrahydrofolate cyclodeaminase